MALSQIEAISEKNKLEICMLSILRVRFCRWVAYKGARDHSSWKGRQLWVVKDYATILVERAIYR